MTFSSCLTNHDQALVLDASVIINLLATGSVGAILQALDVRLIVTDNVVREIGQGEVNGRQEPKLLAELIGNQILRVEELAGPSLENFFDMISGHTSNSLGDGEAATIAFAHNNGFSAAIDEKKAARIVGERFGALKLVTTVDILAYGPVQASLGHETLSNATLRALRHARMQVRDHQVDWIVQLIGVENLMACSSLKRHARSKVKSLGPATIACGDAIK
ncbi:hypothetical protein ACNQFN_06175 [Thauera butanivorans]|uniref:hypothetical protein n=1 Tax=Thauera butanivorans TaxID=86174 RepID=UPI003AB60F7B